MEYRFNCTKCGKALTQETVLYEFLDNLYLLKKGGEQLLGEKASVNTNSPFQRIRMNLLLRELRQILGEDWEKALTEIVVCKLPLKDMLRYVGNHHNSRFPALGELTRADIETFISEPGKLGKETANIFEGFILARSDYGTSASDNELRDRMKKEFEELLDLFRGEVCCFGIKLLRDTHNKAIITGFELHDVRGDNPVKGSARAFRNPRICPEHDCNARLFERAGAARQIQIGFIGRQGAGKTSAILAVANALRKGASTWNSEDFQALAECMSMNDIHPENLSGDEMVRIELNKYSRGEAPMKTSVKRRKRGDGQSADISEAYAITLQLREDLLLTLTDIPGEVFDPKTGYLSKDHLAFFESVLRVDAFVFCYDASQNEEAVELQKTPDKFYMLPEPMQQEFRMMVNLLNGKAAEGEKKDNEPHKIACTWLREIQEERAGKNKQGGQQVPVLILYMKDPSVEREENIENANRGRNNRLNYGGIFPNEQVILETEELRKRYASFREEHKRKAADKYYYTELRCSPYGFVATNENVREGARIAYNDASQNEEMICKRAKKIAEFIGTLESQVQEKEHAYEELDAICNDRSKWKGYFQKRLDECRTAYDAAKKNWDEQQETLNKQQEQQDEREAQIAQVSEQLAQAADAEALMKELSEEVLKIETRRKENAAKQDEKDRKLEVLRKACTDLGKKCAEFNARNRERLETGDEETRKQKAVLETQHNEAQKKLRDAERELREWERQREALEQQDRPLLQRYQNAKVRSSNREALKAQRERLESELAGDNVELVRAKDELKNAREILDESEKLVWEATQCQKMSEADQEAFLSKQNEEASNALDRAKEQLTVAKSTETYVEKYQTIARERREKVHQEYIKIMQESRTPEPKNVGHLARWILYVSGAASMSLSDSEGQSLGEYFCHPPEFREKDMRNHSDTQPKQSLWARFCGFIGGRIDQRGFEEYKKIAAAHCYLFVNPTRQDKDMCDCLDSGRAAEILRNPE